MTSAPYYKTPSGILLREAGYYPVTVLRLSDPGTGPSGLKYFVVHLRIDEPGFADLDVRDSLVYGPMTRKTRNGADVRFRARDFAFVFDAAVGSAIHVCATRQERELLVSDFEPVVGKRGFAVLVNDCFDSKCRIAVTSYVTQVAYNVVTRSELLRRWPAKYVDDALREDSMFGTKERT